MTYRVAFSKRVDSEGTESMMKPSAELDQNLADGVVAEKSFVEEIETEALHGQEELGEDDSFLGSAAAEVWEYVVVDARAVEFEEALANSDLIMEYDIVDDTVVSASEASAGVLGNSGVYPPDGKSQAGLDDLTSLTADDPRLGLTNVGSTPPLDWAADTGPTRTPEIEAEELTDETVPTRGRRA